MSYIKSILSTQYNKVSENDQRSKPSFLNLSEKTKTLDSATDTLVILVGILPFYHQTQEN